MIFAFTVRFSLWSGSRWYSAQTVSIPGKPWNMTGVWVILLPTSKKYNETEKKCKTNEVCCLGVLWGKCVALNPMRFNGLNPTDYEHGLYVYHFSTGESINLWHNYKKKRIYKQWIVLCCYVIACSHPYVFKIECFAIWEIPRAWPGLESESGCFLLEDSFGYIFNEPGKLQ